MKKQKTTIKIAMSFFLDSLLSSTITNKNNNNNNNLEEIRKISRDNLVKAQRGFFS